MKKAVEINSLYSAQPKRVCCKLCQTTFSKDRDFSSHGVDYVFCEKCSHLNGIYEDTKAFVKSLYISDSGKGYASNYLDKSFEKRAIEVYLPKVDFLASVLPTKRNKILDVGCGSGYFAYAALLRNLEITGLDVSKTMVEFGNSQIQRILGSSPLNFTEEEGFFETIKNTDADVVSAIGVIEHLREPEKFFKAFNESNAQYLYYLVPMFSLSAALETVSNDVYPRLLSSGHTHLFTERSIAEMHKIIKVSPIGTWRFGTDFLDLYRHLIVKMKANNVSQKMTDFITSGFGERIDELQNILDLNHFCSEIHVVVEKINFVQNPETIAPLMY